MVAHRLSPSGPFVTTDRLRWYGHDQPPNLLEQTTRMSRLEEDNFITVDPITNLQQLEESAFSIQAESYSIGQIVVQRLVGDPSGVTNPSGDADIVFQMQRFNPATNVQTNVGDPISFAPDEFGKKVVQFGGLVPVDEFLFCRVTFPENFDPGDKELVWYCVAENIS